MRNLACIFLLFVFGGRARATMENAALQLALEDIVTLPREEQLFTRYIWVTDGEFESVQAVSLTLNYISRGTVIFRPFFRSHEVVINSCKHRISVVRVTLRAYAPKQEDLDDLINQWENFQFDPRFNLLLTKDTLKFAGAILDKIPKHKISKWILKDVTPFYDNGKLYNQKWVKEVKEIKAFGKDVQIIRIVSEHLDKKLITALIDATQSQAPVVNHRYFITRALTTIKGKGLFPIIYGGLYYELSGIKKGFKKGTDEDNFLAKLGIGNIEQGIDAKKVFDDIRSDQRVAMFQSGVTGKPRRADILRTLAGRDSQGIVSITHDLKDDDIDIETHPIMNLIDFKDRAREVIYEKQNGLHGFVLFNGEGALQDEVPPDVAADVTIPPPHGTRLEPAIGCIRCHAKEGGWRVCTNDVRTLTKKRLDIFNDRKKSTPDVLDRLAGLYAGDFEFKIFLRARDDYASGILRATGPWKSSKDQTDVVRISGDKLATLFNQYNYDQVSASSALKELGITGFQEKQAVETLQKLIPPVLILVDGIVPEDPRIGALLSGISINRSDWDLVYSFVATRLDKR